MKKLLPLLLVLTVAGCQPKQFVYDASNVEMEAIVDESVDETAEASEQLFKNGQWAGVVALRDALSDPNSSVVQYAKWSEQLLAIDDALRADDVKAAKPLIETARQTSEIAAVLPSFEERLQKIEEAQAAAAKRAQEEANRRPFTKQEKYAALSRIHTLYDQEEQALQQIDSPTSAEMYGAIHDRDQRMDDLLNETYQQLKRYLPEAQFIAERDRQRQWLKNLDAELSKDTVLNGSARGAVEAQVRTEWTEQKIKEWIEQYGK